MYINNEKCKYCGGIAECKEHVIPVVYLSIGRSYDPHKSWIVPACNTCNRLAGTFIAFSIAEKANFITKKFKIKYRRLLNQPEWTEEEMNELDHNLKNMIWGSLIAKRVAIEKLKILESTCQLPINFERPDFVEFQIKEAMEILDIKQKKVKKKRKSKKNKDIL